MKRLILISLMLLILASVVPAYAVTAETEIHPYNQFWKHRASQIEYLGSSLSDFLGSLTPLDPTAYYTTSEVDIKLADKADTGDVALKQDISDMVNYYTKTAADLLFADKADTDSVYTKVASDALYATIASLSNYYLKTETYSTSEVNVLLALKASLAYVNSTDEAILLALNTFIDTTAPGLYATISNLSSYLPLSTIQAAGDLLVGTGSGAVGRIAIGGNGTVLTSNGTTASWVTPSSSIPIFTPLSMANGDYTGEVIIDTMADSATVGQCLYLASGGWTIADADSATTMPALGLCVETGTGDRKVLTHGYVRNTSWSFTKGQLIYVSQTAGAITATAPSASTTQRQKIGIALSATVVYFFFDATLVEN